MNVVNIIMDKISEDEFECTILRFGSLLGMMHGKHLSCVSVFIELYNNTFMRKIIQDQLDCEWYEIVKYMTFRYPVLHKSKKIANNL